MATTITGSRMRTRQPLSALTRLTVAGLVGIGILIPFSIIVIVGGKVDARGLFFTVFAWLLAALVAGRPVGGWRWSPVLGTILGSLLLMMAAPYMQHGLSHPESTLVFAFWVVFLPVILIAGLAGIAATVQNYRAAPAERLPPRWLPYALTALVALCVGAILVVLIPQQSAAAGVSTETLADLPALTASHTKFGQVEIRAKVGETVALRLDNADSVPHSFDIDAFNIHAPMPVGNPGLALFKASTAGSYTFYCSMPGHREAGMVGTLIVAP
jgi:uncharacterized cupredoxin-like copper-binding protein